MSEISFINSKRGGKLLQYQNFLFRLERRRENLSYWKCSTNSKCKARIVLAEGVLKSFSGFHTHEPATAYIQRKCFSSKLKERAITEMTVPVPTIYKEELARIEATYESALCLPSFHNAEHFMYKARSSVRSLLRNNKEDINLSELQGKIKNGEDFLLAGGEEENGILESCSKAGTSSSTSPTPSRSSTASQASTVTSGSSKNGVATSNRPPKPPPPPRAHSLLPSNKAVRNADGTFKIPNANGDASSSEDVTASVPKPQAPKRQCKSVVIKSEYSNLEETVIEDLQQNTSLDTTLESDKQNISQEENKNTSSIQIFKNENIENFEEQESIRSSDNSSTINCTSTLLSKADNEDVHLTTSTEGLYDNLETTNEPKIQTSITIKSNASNQKDKISTCVVSRTKTSPLSKAPARPPPIYSKPQSGNFPKNMHPWKTLEDSYLALTSSNRELLIKLVNQALKKRKNYSSKLNKFQFHWTDFEIDVSQPSSVFAFGEKIAYHATMPKYPEYSLTLVIAIQQQSHLQENSEIKYPLFGKFTDCIPSELLDSSSDNELESMPATILVLDRSNILTIEYFSESLPESLTAENEKELCFITLQLIQSLKSLQAQGIESIDTNCQNLLLAKTKHDKYHTLVFLYDICYEENDYSSDSCKISLCQYTLMLLFQMLRIQAIDECVLQAKFSSDMSKKVFETAFSLLLEEKAVSLSQTKTLFECYLWGVTRVLESLQHWDDCDSILHRWLDIERSNCIKCIVNDEEYDLNIQNEYYSQFLIRTNVRSIREVASYL